MPSQYRIERARGLKDSPQQLAVLRQKWPLAFPVEKQDVRPLAVGSTREIATTMGWSQPYTVGVLQRWKMASAYCQAVLGHDQRIALDGAPAGAIDAEAKDLAAKRLTLLATRKTAKVAAVKLKPVSPPSAKLAETSEQLRARVRAGLLRRRT